MKTLKFTLLVIVIMFFTCSYTWAKVWHVDVVVTFTNFDYGEYGCPEVGIVNGTYTYRYAIKLSETNKIESVHWIILDSDVHKLNGEKVIFVDSGHDNLGYIWDFFNRPDYYNGLNSGIDYSSNEGWLNDYMPLLMPLEGTIVAMAFRVMYKGNKFIDLAGMVQLHMNAKGFIKADVKKGYYEAL